MNGKPLTQDHGYPARLIVPGWYGMASVKWLSKITISNNSFQTYFNDVKYVYKWKDTPRIEPVREIQVKSLITNPLDGDVVRLGQRFTVSGKAWTGFGKIVRVEIRYGEGSWEEAELGNYQGPHSWITWRKELITSEKGRFAISSRATDSKGNTQ